MIIQRPECTTGTAIITGQYRNAPKDLVDGKMQQQHIKRLLSTAATATGIVGDVDALPAPAHIGQKAERNLWRLEEIREVLNIMQQINALELLNDKTVKSEKVFRNIELMMHRKGYRKKSHSQIWTKWKFLKSTYMTSRRNRIVPKMIPYEIYQILHKMLSSSFGINAGNSSTASIDEENSNCEDISLNSGNTGKVKAEQNELGHPIFGFRLGHVKSEPVDTGYETTANNSAISETDSFEGSAALLPTFSPSNSNGNMTQHSFIDIKEERVTDSPPPLSPTELSQHTPQETSLLIPRNTNSMSITTVSSNTADLNNKSASSSTILPMPPLRIAPFANERNMKEALMRLDRSPPPLILNRIGIAAAQNTIEEDGTTFIRKMLRNSETGAVTAVATTSLSNVTTRPSVLRLPKEVTLQPRASDCDSSSTRLRQVPMRQMAYSLRPERSITNTCDVLPATVQQNQTASLHNKDIAAYHNLEEPMTSQMATQINAKIRTSSLSHLRHKKRRLDIPTWSDINAVHPTKVTRSVSSTMVNNQQKNGNTNNSNCELQNPLNASKTPPKIETSGSDEPAINTNSIHGDRSVMEEMLKDLAMTLRKAQLEMINNFFENQMEITRREHEYQMKQDQIVMEAFQEQSRQLMNSASKFFGLNLKRTQKNCESKTKKTKTDQQLLIKVGNGSIDENNLKKNSTLKVSENNEINNAWLDENNYSSSECLEDEPENDNIESAVDPIQFVSSELVEEYDNS